MKNFVSKLLFALISLAVGLIFLGCGASAPAPSTSSSSAPSVSVSVTPDISAVQTGQTIQFSASVKGTTQTQVTWSISGSSADGSINTSGVYTAPSSAPQGSIKVTATSVADEAANASATIWVLAPGQVSTTSNPLVAQYSMTVPTDAKVKVEFGTDTSYGMDTWSQATPTGGGLVNVLVAGMEASTTYHMHAVVTLSDGTVFQDEDHTFTTGPVPSSIIPTMTVTSSSTLKPQSGVYMLDLVGNGGNNTLLHVLAVNLKGKVVWYYNYNGENGNLVVNPIKLLPNGHLMAIIGPPSQYAIGNPYDDFAVLREFDLAGNTIRQITIPELNQKLAAMGVKWTALDMHHDFVYIPNGSAKGHVVVLVNHVETINGTQVLGDALVDLDQNFNPDWVWDTFDHLDVNRHPFGLPDWTHCNGLVYSPDDGNLLLSVRLQSWVVKIDYEDATGSGNILWKFGYQGDFTMQNGGSADWPYVAHGPIILSPNSTGTFLFGMFDNGIGRVLDNGTVCGSSTNPCYSRVPIFSIDEATKTTHVVWQDKLPLVSPILGNMQTLQNGDVTFDIGDYNNSPEEAHIMEVTEEATPQTVWELDETGQWAYRGEYMSSLYPGVQW